MNSIRLSADANASDLAAMFRRMSSITSWEDWRSRNEGLASLQRGNPLWADFIRKKYELELAFAQIHRHVQNTGRFPWPPTTEQYRLYSFVAVVVQVFEGIGTEGRRKLSGAMRGGLRRDYGLGPLAFEMKIAAHLATRGFNVEFHDLEVGNGYDFLATSGSTKVEVECKHVSGDIGRQIHRATLVAFGSLIEPILIKAVARQIGGTLARVSLPGRLPADAAQQAALRDHIDTLLSSGRTQQTNESVEDFALGRSPFAKMNPPPSMRDVREYLQDNHGVTNESVLARWQASKGAVVLILQSEKPDRVLSRMLKVLKDDAKRQFSTNRPAIFCIHLSDVTEAELTGLATIESSGETTGIQLVASHILTRRPHIHSVALTTDGSLLATPRSTRESGLSYVYSNPDHPADDPLLRNLFFP